MNGKRKQIIQTHFSDVPELVSENERFGLFQGDGTDNHFQVQQSPTRAGVDYKVHCDNCGTPNVITVDWNELIFIGSSRLPPGWHYDNGRMYPNVGCANGNCNYICSIQITPDEAAKHVHAALQAQVVSPQHVAAVRRQLGLG